MSRQQVFALNCCMFLGCFDLDREAKKMYKFSQFNYMYWLEKGSQTEKLKCLLNYYECIYLEKDNQGFLNEMVTY